MDPRYLWGLFVIILSISLDNVASKKSRIVKGQCGQAYDLENTGVVKIVAGGNETTCTFELIGSANCRPELKCSKITLTGEGEECGEHYMQISDAWGGNYRICSEKSLKEKETLRASRGARDIFITIKGNGKKGQVRCEAFCKIKEPESRRKIRAAPEEALLTKTKKKKIENRCVCGFKNDDDRIVGGEDAGKYEFPWMASLVEKGTRIEVCGGAVVNDRWILTAAHCWILSGMGKEEIEVLLHAHVMDTHIIDKINENATYGEKGFYKNPGWDSTNVTDEDENSIRVEVAEMINHPLFGKHMDYDVALLKLATPLNFVTDDRVTPICLPELGDKRDFVGNTCTVSGWGMAHENAATATRLLQKLDVPVIANPVCEKAMSFRLSGRMMCAGYLEGGKDGCQGDSGGPLITKEESGQYTQVGIVSFGEGCARKDRPGIYSRVTELIDWIEFHMRASDPIWCKTTLN